MTHHVQLKTDTRPLADLLERAAACAHEGIIVTEALPLPGDGPRIVFINPTFTRLTGLSCTDLLGKPPAVLQEHAHLDEATQAMVQRCMAAWQPFRAESLYTRKDGSSFWAEVGGWPVADADGRFTHWFAVLRDVTERKRTEQALRDSEARYRALVDAMTSGVFRMDADGKVLELSDHIWRDYPPPEGGHWTDLIHPDDHAAKHDAIWKETVRAGNPPEHTYRIRRRDGEYRWRQVRAFPIRDTDSGAIREWVGTITDITEQRELEVARRRLAEWLSFAMEASEDGIYDWNVREECLHFNDRALQMMGLSGTPTTNNLYTWIERVHPDDGPDLLEAMREIRAGRWTTFRGELRVQHRDGAYRWFLSRAKAVETDDAGRPLRVVGTLTDITLSKRMEQQLVDLLEEAQFRAERDSLTRLLNHGAFHQRMEEMHAESAREDHSFALVLIDLDHFKFFNDAYGHSVGDAVLRRIAELLESSQHPSAILGRLGGDEFGVLIPDVLPLDREELAAEFAALSRSVGYRPQGYDYEIPLTLSAGVAIYPDDGETLRDLMEMADERLRLTKQDSRATAADALRKTLTARIQGFPMLDALVSAVDNKDRYTRRHSEDVLLYSLMIAQELGISGEERSSLMAAALVHDVGKIGVPDRVLRLPGRLSDTDYAAMKQHAELGAVLVSAVKGLESTLDAVRHHHERWDGTGYPDGLAGECIPLPARIMAVADAFSAMTTDRPYRRGMSFGDALNLLTEGAGIHWDPICVRALVTSVGSAPDAATLLARTDFRLFLAE